MPLPSHRVDGEPRRVRRARPLLGTLVEIDVEARQSLAALNNAIDAAFGVIERVQQLMSYQDLGSELSRINRDAVRRRQRIDAQTFEVLQAALQFARLSDGAFNPCAAQGSSWCDIELFDEGYVRLHAPLSLNLSGIAKGFAVDQAVAVLQHRCVERLMVNAGGDLRVLGAEPWQVNLRHPQDPARVGHSLALQHTALATSAPYFARALINRRDATPYEGNRSVSVCAERCMAADALTKIVLFAEPSLAAHCLDVYAANAYVLSGTALSSAAPAHTATPPPAAAPHHPSAGANPC